MSTGEHLLNETWFSTAAINLVFQSVSNVVRKKYKLYFITKGRTNTADCGYEALKFLFSFQYKLLQIVYVF